jgi:small-conductance mechanosensitive channel
MVQRASIPPSAPPPHIDAGLRKHIRTAWPSRNIVAGGVRYTYLGLSLDRIKIAAGALSVYRFGLQSSVNKLVSA